MRRILHLSLGLLVAVALGVVLSGCDESPTSVEDFDIQPDLESPGTANLVLIGDAATEFTYTYQGLDSPPSVTASGNLVAEVASTEGSPDRGGSDVIRLTYDGTPQGIVRETVAISAQAGGRQIADTVAVSIAPFAVSTDFRPNSVVVTDYDDRSYTAVGGATATIVESSSAGLTNTTGVNTLEIQDPGDGSAVEFDRQASVPDSDRFQFAIRPDASSDFNLTIAFTEEADGSTVTYEYTLPVEAGDNWLQLGIGFDQIDPAFDPVDSRAGGSGALQSVSFSADANVTYYLDDLSFATATTAQAELHNFESTTLEYSCEPVTLESSNDVADESVGFTSRRVDGGGCFGYNYNNLRADLTASSVVTMRVKGTAEGDGLFIFLETTDGGGGFNFDNGVEYELPVTSEWTTFSVPVSDLGESPETIYSEGLGNVGFESRGSDPDFLIDDIRLAPAGN